mgnify:CR=1 FL=1
MSDLSALLSRVRLTLDDPDGKRFSDALLTTAMRQALENNDFHLHFQPQVNLASGDIFGAEALIRWHDRELGDIPPAKFIPVAEQTGVIVAISHAAIVDVIV